MRLFFIASILMVFGLGQIQGQRPRFHPQVHELTLQLGSVQAFTELEGTQFTPLNGFRYAYHFDQKRALRLGGFYRKGTFSSPGIISEIYQPFEAKQQSAEFRLGYMFKHNIYRLQLYAGLDAIVRYAWLSEDYMADLNVAANKRKFPSYGASAFVGARMFANKHASMGVEVDVYGLFHNRRQEDNVSPARTPSEGLFIDREIGSNFLSVYISYHFKKIRKSCTCGKPGS
ncbi:MAG: hypothetical protein AB8F95_12630 [Bacteroidia bacterium]